MKIKNILIFAALTGTLCACSDLFEPAIENAQSEEQIFTNAESAVGLLGYAYAMLPFETKSATDIATDDAVTNDLENANRLMAQGKWTANNDPISQWQARKATIQYINTLISYITMLDVGLLYCVFGEDLFYFLFIKDISIAIRHSIGNYNPSNIKFIRHKF